MISTYTEPSGGGYPPQDQKGENKMGILIINEEYEAFDETVVEIDAWYDRHTRDYCIQLLNKDGYQVGDCYRVGTKAGKDAIVRDLKEEYGLK